jgi:hypothetical protein
LVSVLRLLEQHAQQGILEQLAPLTSRALAEFERVRSFLDHHVATHEAGAR